MSDLHTDSTNCTTSSNKHMCTRSVTSEESDISCMLTPASARLHIFLTLHRSWMAQISTLDILIVHFANLQKKAFSVGPKTAWGSITSFLLVLTKPRRKKKHRKQL